MRRSVNTAAASRFGGVAACLQDPILGLVAAFKTDPAPRKVNLAQGAYRTDEGEPLVLDVVKEAEVVIASDASLNKEYIGVEGNTEFNRLSAEFAFGEASPALAENRVATVQSLSGTGALRICAAFLAQFDGRSAGTIHLPSPSWGNHTNIFRAGGLDVASYDYVDSSGTALDFGAMRNALSNQVLHGGAVLLHACAHNPTGIDPTHAEWEELAAICAERSLLPVFDSAYQGYASGDPDVDAFAVRCFERVGVKNMLVCQSYAKNMGLYGERVGAFDVVCDDASEAAAVLSQLKQAIVRPMYSSPPLHGARIAAAILGDDSLRARWLVELAAMSTRIARVRLELVAALVAAQTPPPNALCDASWSHISSQIGMFAFTGLSKESVEQLRTRHHVYLTADGRMSLAGLGSRDIEYVAHAVADVLAP